MNRIKEFLKDKKKRNWLLLAATVLIIILATIIFHDNKKGEPKEKTFSSFLQFLESDQAKKMNGVTMKELPQTLTYTYKGDEYTVKIPRSYFSSYFSEKEGKENAFSRNNIEVDFEPASINGFSLFLQVLQSFIFLLFIIFIFRMFISPKGMKVHEVTNEKTTFADIAGYESVKEELLDIVDFLKHPDDYSKYTSSLPKGVLLEGPPGNGKTFFAKAIAGEAKTPFFQISAADIEDKYIGTGAKKIEKLFATVRKAAKKHGHAIMFIDEIDAVGAKRENRTVTETNQTINKLLTEMDGFNKEDRIVILAATNLSSSLDSALVRSGRFDRIIHIDKPSLAEREAIIQLYLKKKEELIDNEVWEENYAYVLAQQTEGFSNADLNKLVNESSLMAKKQGASSITISSLREAFTRIVAGPKTNKVLTEEDKKIIAYHEAGHAAVQLLTSEDGYKSVAYITVTSHGQALGHVSHVSRERVLLKRSDIQKQIMVTLGGRAVEDIILNGDFTTGAASDLQRVNQLLLSFVTKYGMNKQYMHSFIERHDENNELTQKLIKETREFLYQDTLFLINKHFDVIDKIAKHLLHHTSIEQHELPELLKGTSYEQRSEFSNIHNGNVNNKVNIY